jgi:multidrug efflux pump
VAVFAGMFGVTLFGIFLTPVFYYVIMWLTGGRAGRPTPGQPGPPRAEDDRADGRKGAAAADGTAAIQHLGS